MTTETTPVGVAVVGLGFWGTVLAEAAARTPSLRLVACVSRRPDRAAEVAGRFGCQALISLDEALAHPDVEAVVLATGNPDHTSGIVAAAHAGRHVFVEKPLANTLPEAREAAAAAGQAGIVLAVGHEFRRTGAARAMKRLLDGGAIGEVVLAEANFSLPARLRPGSWKWSAEGCPGGTLIQLGIHHLETLTHLLGEATVTGAVLERRASQAPIPTVAAVTLQHASGATSVVTSSYVSPRTYFIHVYGTQGALLYRTDPGARVHADRLDEVTQLLLQRNDSVEAVPFTSCDPLVDELADFAAAIRGRGEVEVGAAEGIAALELVWQALRAVA
ncbi:MAG: Gfo/Idh/MocA family protein [Anaerolineae bacterium]